MDKSKTKGLCRLIAKLTAAANRSVRKNDKKGLKRDSTKVGFKLPLAMNNYESRFAKSRFLD